MPGEALAGLTPGVAAGAGLGAEEVDGAAVTGEEDAGAAADETEVESGADGDGADGVAARPPPAFAAWGGAAVAVGLPPPL